MTREERDLDGLIVPGSDHLTAYNLYAEAYQMSPAAWARCTACRGTSSTKSRSSEWAERRGVLVKSIEDAALGMASVYRAVGLPLPAAHAEWRARTRCASSSSCSRSTCRSRS